jgi:hypothetical protein
MVKNLTDEWEVLVPMGPTKYDFPVVSLNMKERFSFNRHAFILLQNLAGGEAVENVKVLINKKDKDVFALVPVPKTDPTGKRVGKSSKKGRYLDGRGIIKKLGWTIEETKTYRVFSDSERGFLLVDRNEQV